MRDLDTLLNSLVNSDLNPSLQFSPQRLRPPRLSQICSTTNCNATCQATRGDSACRQNFERHRDARARRHAKSIEDRLRVRGHS
jgi:hypothetical protein